MSLASRRRGRPTEIRQDREVVAHFVADPARALFALIQADPRPRRVQPGYEHYFGPAAGRVQPQRLGHIRRPVRLGATEGDRASGIVVRLDHLAVVGSPSREGGRVSDIVLTVLLLYFPPTLAPARVRSPAAFWETAIGRLCAKAWSVSGAGYA